MAWVKRLRGTFWLGLGYLLSPLSWWNDLIFNFPLAYGFAYLVTWGHRDWFWTATVVGYWFSNVLGMVMMQWGATDILFTDQPRNWKRELWLGLASSTAYTLAIAGLVYFHILNLPDFLAVG
jgi:hypothetical protein